MSELPSVRRRIQTLQRYMSALDAGDAEMIAAVLNDAGQDPGLERMILDVNAVYQHEDRTIVRAADAAAAQQLLLKLADQTIGREDMQNPSLHGKDDPEHALIDTTQVDSRNDHDHLAEKKLQGKKFATPVFPAKMVATQKWYYSRKSWIAAAAAAILIAILVLPGTSALASQFLSLFRVQHFQTVQVTNQDAVTLSQYKAPRLEDLGSVHFQANSFHARNNLTLTQAVKSVNFSVALPGKLPDGVNNSPSFSVLEGGHGVFTFSAAKMHAYLVKNGHGNVKIPANLDGATFDVTITAGIMAKYGYHGGNPFIVVEMPSPVIRATGSASLEELQNFMLSLPGLPSSLVAQLKQINLSNGTVPIPVPAGIDAQSVTVKGASGVLLNSNKTTPVAGIDAQSVTVKGASGVLKTTPVAGSEQFPVGSMIVWQTKGIIYALGGITTNATQLLAAANSI